MAYHNLNATIMKLQTLGLWETLQRIVSEAQLPRIEKSEIMWTFGSEQVARRVQLTIYEYLYFYPMAKARISMSRKGNRLIVRLNVRRETRGRKGRKKP